MIDFIAITGGSGLSLSAGTNYIECIIDVDLTTVGGLRYWTVTAAAFASNTSKTSNTGDINTATTGKRVIQVATVTSSGGDVTGITQLVHGDIWFNSDEIDVGPYYITLADDTTIVIDRTDALSGFDAATHTDWSLTLTVSGGVITAAASPVGSNATALYDGDAATSTAQTFCRIPVIRDSLVVTGGGAFRENTHCKGSKGPIVEVI